MMLTQLFDDNTEAFHPAADGRQFRRRYWRPIVGLEAGFPTPGGCVRDDSERRIARLHDEAGFG